jgi:K319-like protein
MVTRQLHAKQQPNGATVTPENSDDHGDDALDYVALNGMQAQYWQGNSGTSAIQFTGGESTTATASLGWSDWSTTTIRSSLGWYFTALPTGGNVQIMQFRTASGNLIGCNLTTAGKINIGTTSGTFSWTSPAILGLNAWYSIDPGILVDAVNGDINANIRLFDSASPVSGGALDSPAINDGSDPIVWFRFGKLTTGAGLPNFFARNIRVDDSTSALYGPYVETNTPPVVSAGADATVAVGASTTRSMTATDSDGTIAAQQWTMQTVPAGVNLPTFPAGASFTYTWPKAGTYVLQASATDNLNATSADTVVFTAQAATAPTAAVNQTITPGLIDARSSAPASGGALTYSISPTGPSVVAPGLWYQAPGSIPATYTVTVTEAGNANTATATTVVPAAAGGAVAPFNRQLVTLNLPVPGDPDTDGQWGTPLNGEISKLSAALNDIIIRLNQ